MGRILIIALIMSMIVFSSISIAGAYEGTSLLSGTRYKNPQMACLSGSQCMLLVYDNSTDNLLIYSTVNAFADLDFVTQLTSVGFSSWEVDYMDGYNLPYDIVYNSPNYYFFVKNSLYSANTTNIYHIAEWDTSRWGLQFVNSSSVFVFDAYHGDDGNASYRVMDYLTNVTHVVGNVSYGACTGDDNVTYPVQKLKGFAARSTGGSVAFNMSFSYNDTDCGDASFGLTTFPDVFDGVFEYISAGSRYIYYRNGTAVRRVSTNDFVTYSSPATYYVFGSGEDVSVESRVELSGYDVYVDEFHSASSDGIFYVNAYEVTDYTPASEYANSDIYVPVDLTSWVEALLGESWYDPKVACELNGQHCAVLAWNNANALFGGGLWVLWSSDDFAGSPSYEDYVRFDTATMAQYWDDAVMTTSDFDYAKMPYDIMYDVDTGKYMILVDDTSSQTGAELWSYSVEDSPRLTYLLTYYYDERPTGIGCAGWSNCWNDVHPLHFADKDSTQPLVHVLYDHCTSIGGVGDPCTSSREKMQTFLLNGTHVSTVTLTSSAGAGNYNPRTKVRSVIADEQVGYYRIRADGGVCGSREYDNIVTNFPTDYLGYTYINDGGADFKYAREYSSADVPEGFYSTSTSDFTSYGTPVLYYALNKTINELIKNTDTMLIEGADVYAYSRFSTGMPSTGIYFARKSLTPLYIYSQAEDPLTGTFTPANITATLTATDGYTESDSGNDFVLHTTVPSSNQMSFLTTSYLPISTTTVFDVPDGCDNMFFYPYYLPQSYSVPIYVFDAITGDPVSGATVRVNSNYYTTGADGNVTVVLSPLANANFSATIDGCNIVYEPSGTPRTYLVQISKTGYRTSTYTAETFIEVSGAGFTYSPYKAYNLDSGTQVVVSVTTKDLIGVDEGRVTVNASNMDYIYPSTPATSFPATWKVVNGTYPATLYLNLSLAECTSVYNTSAVLTILQTDYSRSYAFKLPYLASEMPCQYSADCIASYCVGNIYHELIGCNAGSCECEYDIETCVLCDNDIGCYDSTSTTECRFDSECYGLNNCADDYTLESWTCGDSGYCFGQYLECGYLCSEDVCIPSSSEAGDTCDQSTVLGMITCMQSGMVSFVSYTYDPLMTFGVALGLVMIVIMILTLGFKTVSGVSKVMR